MRKAKYVFAVLAVLMVSSALWAQASKPEEKPTVSSDLAKSVSGVEGEVVPAAEAMPEDKYSYVPSTGEFKGVRNFGQQMKHIAAVNYIIAAAILGEKPPVDTGEENGPDSVKSKADIVKFLKDSYAYANKAVASTNEKNAVEPIKSPFGNGTTTRLRMSVLIVGHSFDHYGQIVEYLRLNGIVPPASR
jgi:uncharacterized damage-inducible protein DinB